MKRILMLSQSVFPPDIRLEKEIKSLSESGYSITVICNQFERNVAGDFKYCSIERLSAPFSKSKVNKIINFPIFFNPRYLSKILNVIIRQKPDYIHAHDLPMIPIALMIKFLFGIPVIYDMHENYPEALKFFKKKGIINFIFKNYRLAKILDKFCIKHCDKIIVVVEENKNRLVNLGINTEKISIVSNTVDPDTFAGEKIDDRVAAEFKDKFVIIYTGKVSPERGLEISILALNKIKDKIKNILLLILGDGPSVKPLSKLAIECNVEKFVRFIPWVGHDKINSYIISATVCIIPQPNNDFINTTVPHKLFEYMFLGKPVLVSDADSLKRIVNETKCGRVFISNDENSFAEEILFLGSDFNNYGVNGRAAVLNKYNWLNDSGVLIGLYQSLG